MNDEQKQELLELWRKTPYLTYGESLSLLAGCLPNTKRTVKFAEEESTPARSKLIEQILIDDIRQFKLKVYFWKTYVYDGEIQLLEPEYATQDTLHYYVPPPPENYAGFWIFGKLSTQELRDWLQDKGISSSFFDTIANNIQTSHNDKIPEHSDTPTLAVKEASPQDVFPIGFSRQCVVNQLIV